jgi:hypothetical protein
MKSENEVYPMKMKLGDRKGNTTEIKKISIMFQKRVLIILCDHLEVGFTAKWPKKVSFDIKQLRW